MHKWWLTWGRRADTFCRESCLMAKLARALASIEQVLYALAL